MLAYLDVDIDWQVSINNIVVETFYVFKYVCILLRYLGSFSPLYILIQTHVSFKTHLTLPLKAHSKYTTGVATLSCIHTSYRLKINAILCCLLLKKRKNNRVPNRVNRLLELEKIFLILVSWKVLSFFSY